VIKLYGQLAIILILRLLSRDCWLVVVLGQNEHCHGQSDAQQFRFCCLVPDARARKRVLINFGAICWPTGAPTLDLENYWEIAFLHE
jgi:hypothetical protein